MATRQPGRRPLFAENPVTIANARNVRRPEGNVGSVNPDINCAPERTLCPLYLGRCHLDLLGLHFASYESLEQYTSEAPPRRKFTLLKRCPVHTPLVTH